jgi:hypothetical protein
VNISVGKVDLSAGWEYIKDEILFGTFVKSTDSAEFFSASKILVTSLHSSRTCAIS